jgi:hypothetical protein
MFLLDTNVISEMRKASRTKTYSPKMDDRVASWVESVPAVQLYLSVVSILELERGFHLLQQRDPEQAAMIRSWVRNSVVPGFGDRILAVDLEIAQRCAALQTPNPIEFRDSLIAATAIVRGMTVVTRNVAHFEGSGVSILNPWNT